MLGVWEFEYAGLPDEGATEPPHIWVDVRGPAGTGSYPCLVDSGSSFSAFPLVVADDLGVPREHLRSTTVRTASGYLDALQLLRPDQLSILVDADTAVPIVPYFFLPEKIEDEEFDSEYHILGRDFFLGLEVTFKQAEGWW